MVASIIKTKRDMTEESPEEDHGSPEIAETNPGSPSSKTNNNNNNINNKEQDRFLPIANVGRIMKKVLPGNGKISKDAKETVQECVSEFISFVTGEASDKCQREKRKTINGDDIIWAITTLGFEDYVAPLKVYLCKYRDTEGEKVNSPKQQQQQQRQQQQQIQQQNHHNYQFQEQDQNNNNMSCTSYISHHHPSPFLPADHQPFPNIAFSPKSLQKQFPQQHDNIDSIHW